MMICRSLTGDAPSDNPFAVDAQQRSSRGKVSIVLFKTLFFFFQLRLEQSLLYHVGPVDYQNLLSTSFFDSNISSTIDPWKVQWNKLPFNKGCTNLFLWLNHGRLNTLAQSTTKSEVLITKWPGINSIKVHFGH